MAEKTLLKWFTIILIIVFVVSSFSVLLYSGSRAASTTTPTPTTGQSFSSNASVSGVRVKSLSNSFVGSCGSKDVSGELKAAGASSVYSFGQGAVGFSFNSSNASISPVEGIFVGCGGLVFRSVTVDFENSFNLRDDKGVVVHTFGIGDLKALPALVNVNRVVGDVVNATFSIVVSDGNVVDQRVIEDASAHVSIVPTSVAESNDSVASSTNNASNASSSVVVNVSSNSS